jgi:hypothetical protein
MARVRLQLLATITLGEPGTDDLKLALDLPTGNVGVAYVGSFIGSDGTEPYTYAVASGSLPTGLSLDTGTGAVTGTPTTVGDYEFTASVTDSAFSPATVSKVVSIRITAGIVFSQRYALGEEGIAYSSGISASGGTPPYMWTIASGSLPTSLSINASTGIVSGTPSAAGVFNFTVRATDSASAPQDFPTSITIAAPVALSGTFPAGVVGLQYSAAPSLTGGVGPFSFVVSSGAIPTGCSFSATSGTVYGVCTAAATYTFDITVTDGLGGTDTSSQSVDFTTAGGGGGSGTVTSVSAGNFSPLFNTAVATATTTPALSFTAIAQAVNNVFAGPASGGSANPTFRALVTADLPNTAVTPTTYGDSTHVAQVTFDAKGRATAASNVAISGFLPVLTAQGLIGGWGEDGAVTFDGVNTFAFASKSGNNYTLLRNLSATTLKIATGCTLNHNSFHVAAQSWDCRTGFYGTFAINGGAGGTPAGANAGAAGTIPVTGSTYFAASGGNSLSTGTLGVATGNSAASGNVTAATGTEGGGSSQGGRGGAGSTGTPGTAGSVGAWQTTVSNSQAPFASIFYPLKSETNTVLVAGQCGQGGTGGTGDGTRFGGGGGGGGAGGGGIHLLIGTVITDGSTPAAMVNCKGGAGGNGSNSGNGTGNVGGGGAGSGGGGGAIYCVIGALSGPSVAGFFDVSGGAGGNGGTGAGTGLAGGGGIGGNAGKAYFLNMATGVSNLSSFYAAGSAAVGATGGAGGNGTANLT